MWQAISDMWQHSRSTESNVVEGPPDYDISTTKSDSYCEYLQLFTVSVESLNFICVFLP